MDGEKSATVLPELKMVIESKKCSKIDKISLKKTMKE